MTPEEIKTLGHAFFDGKTLQYEEDIGDCCSWFDWIYPYCPNFSEGFNWRIKPDEPKKVMEPPTAEQIELEMDIKEIALKVADSLRNKVDGISHMQSNQGLVAFAEALIAEIAKQNEPVAYATTNEEDDLTMLFFDEDEARKYSGDDEPIKLIVKPGE